VFRSPQTYFLQQVNGQRRDHYATWREELAEFGVASY
jgi:hypothetical protein